ncbi:MAG TPA: hypothetical protein VGM88_21335 [Kofleriaceae bacterium]|jgi:hypothetical protein
MVDVHFEVYRVLPHDGVEIPESQLDAYLREHSAFADELGAQEDMDGAIVVDAHALVDDLGPLVHNLCFDAVVATLGDAREYRWSAFASPATYRLSAGNADEASLATTVAGGIRGDDPWSVTHPVRDLLPALYRCGVRYIDFLERLGARGGTYPSERAAYLRAFADRARAALEAAGFDAT